MTDKMRMICYHEVQEWNQEVGFVFFASSREQRLIKGDACGTEADTCYPG